MASSKISELVDGTNLLPGDKTIILRNGANFKVDPTINAVNAWVNFNGTGTVAIRASYNVSSITDNGTGDYTVNFTNALTDADYALVAQAGGSSGVPTTKTPESSGTYSTTAARVQTLSSSTNTDFAFVSVAVIR